MGRVSSLIRRRQFVVGAGATGLGLLGGCGRWPGQAEPRVYRLGFLGLSFSGLPSGLPPPFREALGNLGYVEGQNLLVESRDSGDRADRWAELAAELIALQVEVIATPSYGAVRGAKTVTSTVPIVYLGGGGDLVAEGLVDSLARPGGNVTGVTSAHDRLAGKQLQLLTEAITPIVRLALLWDGTIPSQSQYVGRYLDPPARQLGVPFLILEPRNQDELDGAIEGAIREGADALYVVSTPLTVAQHARVVALAAQYRLPAMYDAVLFVRAGGLMAYQGSPREMFRRGATYVDKIFRGANPTDLPIEQPMTFDFVVNMKTARELGIIFPNEIMLQVTEVIE